MEEDLLNYVKNIEYKMKEKNTLFTLYIQNKRKLVPIGTSNTKRGINEVLNEYMNDYDINEGDTFAIRNGNDFLTTDGEQPDYAKAVEIVGKEKLGLSFGKQGVDIQYGETGLNDVGQTAKTFNQNKVNADTEYRSAYMRIRRNQPGLSKSKITDSMVKKEMQR